jgi:hypothetical protein
LYYYQSSSSSNSTLIETPPIFEHYFSHLRVFKLTSKESAKSLSIPFIISFNLSRHEVGSVKGKGEEDWEEEEEDWDPEEY